MAAAAGAGYEWPHGVSKSRTQPCVSIVTPTYNRRKFIPWLIQCIKEQTYPRERMEWLVYDDGSDKILDILTPHMKELNIRYFTSDTKLNIGEKRNKLNEEARGEVIVVMDDDDYYYPERVAHAIFTMNSKRAELVGSTRNRLFFTDDKSIWEVGPYGPTHATFGTMAYTKKYATDHKCDTTVVYAEELRFTNEFKERLVQLDPEKVMLVMCHSENTFSKSKLRDESNPVVRKTSIKIRNVIKNAKMREFYASA